MFVIRLGDAINEKARDDNHVIRWLYNYALATMVEPSQHLRLRW